MSRETDSPEPFELLDRQDQFGALIGADPELLRGLKFCNSCRGNNYEWTDWSCTDIDGNFFGMNFDAEGDPPQDYRLYLTEIACEICDGSGFEGGNFQLSTEEWIDLAGSGRI